MEQITETIAAIAKKAEQAREKQVEQIEQVSHPFNCKDCKDKGFIYKNQGLYEVAIKCKCQMIKEVRNRMDNSGIGELLEIRKFDNYNAKRDFQKSMKNMAMEFTREFIKGNRCSLAFLGQSGIGKSHLIIAVTKKLLDENIHVKYCIADDIVQKLQACKFDQENYNREFSNIANAGVLFIDDLFKSSVQEYYQKESIKIEDLREVFKVINYRYNKGLPILLNSEIHYERFEELDEATIGRINEMCKYKYLLSVKPDISKNYRLTRRS